MLNIIGLVKDGVKNMTCKTKLLVFFFIFFARNFYVYISGEKKYNVEYVKLVFLPCFYLSRLHLGTEVAAVCSL